jgi:hypothetical protein
MKRQATATLAAVVAIAGSPASAATNGKSCEAFRILKDGRQVRTTYEDSASAALAADDRASAASASSTSSSSSVHVSSSSGGRGSATAMATYTDELGRTVTKTSDEHGCRIVIDERGL